jgi:glycosyltransferase involved in cell wall biosynthesis
MRILFLSRWFPYPANNGSKLRIYSLLRGLSRQHQVTLLSFVDSPDVDADSPELRDVCHDVHIVSLKPFNPRSLRARIGFLSLKPRSVLDVFSAEMAQKIQYLLEKETYDVVVASQIDTAVYSAYFNHMPALFEEVELGVLYERFAHAATWEKRLRYGLTWAKHRRYLASLLDNFAACTVVSDRERNLLSAKVSTQQKVEIVPNCMALAEYQDVVEAPKPNTLIFAGSFTFSPNYEAMVWFLREVYPRVQAAIPDVHLIITGNHADMPLPEAENVTLAGYVDDVRPYIAAAWISLAPIWSGGGTRLKILEAMALRTPVIATTKGAEGIDAHHDQHLLLADTPQAFAEAVVSVLQSHDLRQRLADNAYQLVQEKYDWAAVMPRFLRLIEQVATN